ncbi:FKBP-type peptidyl-prolyl cis-trans isomerase [Phycisphaera mikurensis]|uniref:peptidylprolyl isomerase n=1 Tax=Phycisphaera mikurensis (strain NBRC 102666 / KCTC 22515 / FYK2301M01) TaxID=1142394 RepID=I0IH27_PHYMF|nr:FKBP-type peptidyl-prolyl cis-trans isomerase [Phycisphaera mikurensis]MBB6440820.1 FKBP-type peptidyl-prolyl cis-trans isomerase 2 [Phycisphaera mikurensis]BAM04565.1 putative peptidyl-prolyl cis-trans isomerase [Phycisphaera mikurensis NBRC 102666]
MPITILSPHSGKPVKIRDQDLGRTVRDEEKRVFFVLERPGGGGYYAALTRNGSEKDLARYDALEARTSAGATHVQAVAAATPHDATGPGRPGGKLRWIGLVLALAVLLAAAYLGYRVLFDRGLLPAAAPAPPAVPRLPAVPALPGDVLPSPMPPAPAGAWIVPAASVPAPAAASPRRTAQARDYAVVRYELAAPGGAVIDATHPMKPLGFVLFSGTAFRGLDNTVAGMAVGERRAVELPAAEVDAQLPAGGAAYRLTVELLGLLPGVTKELVRPGETGGRAAAPGDRLRLAWSVRLDGRAEAIVSTADTGGPVAVTLGAGDLIEGLEQNLAGMRVGEVANFRVPPHLAYGAAGAAGGLVPPDADVLVRVELLGLDDAAVAGTGGEEPGR